MLLEVAKASLLAAGWALGGWGRLPLAMVSASVSLGDQNRLGYRDQGLKFRVAQVLKSVQLPGHAQVLQRLADGFRKLDLHLLLG